MRIRNSYGQYWYVASNISYDIYYNNDRHRELLVASDDVEIVNQGAIVEVPGKGKVLTTISAEFAALAGKWGFNTAYICPNIKNAKHVNTLGGLGDALDDKILHIRQLAGRVTFIKKLLMFPMECVVFRHILGPVWDAYRCGKCCDHDLQLPKGLNRGDLMPRPVLVVIDKNSGEAFVDDIEKISEIIKKSSTTTIDSLAMATDIYNMCIEFYEKAYSYASRRWVIIANAIFELGVNDSGQVCFGGGFMTPDSALFWDKADFYVGEYPKQFGIHPIDRYIEDLRSYGINKSYIPRPVLKDAKRGYEKLNQMLFSS